VTQVVPKPIIPAAVRPKPKGARLLHMLSTTDPKDIAILYLITSFGFFMVGGLLAMLMRAELAQPGLQFLSNEQYNQLFTMHGTIMRCSTPHRSCSASPTTSCRCRSAPPTSRSPG